MSDAPNGSVKNGLGEALGCPPIPGIGVGGLSPQNFVGMPGMPGYNGSDAVSGSGTMVRNLRNYLISNFRQVLAQSYAEIGLIQTIVDVPVDDALRGGIEIKSLELEESEIQELQQALERDDDLTTAGTAAKWARLHGGGAIIIVTDQDPETPLAVETLTGDDGVSFKACDLWELSTDGKDAATTEVSKDGDGLPRLRGIDAEFYTYYGVKVHKSRVMRIKGKEAPSFIRPRLRGWGLSVVEILVRSINQYLKATDLTFEVLDEFKLDVFRIKNLVNTLLAPGGDEAVRKRIGTANWYKNYQNALVLDSEDEYDNKQLSFAGLAEAMTGIRMQVASDMRMPLTKLFGISATGFNSGQDDIEVYNGMVESSVRGRLKFDLLRMVEIKCQILFGFVPDDLTIAFKPLRVLSATDEETVKTQKFARLIQSKQAGEITAKEFRDACNRGGLMDITLDTSDVAMDEIEESRPQPPGMGGDDGDDGDDTDDEDDDETDDDRERTFNSDEFDESKHPRADDGKFGKGGGTGSKAGKSKRGGGGSTPLRLREVYDDKALKEKHPELSGVKVHSEGTKDEVTATAKKLRADGVNASIVHMDGPRSGAKSQWVVAVPEKESAKIDVSNHPKVKAAEKKVAEAQAALDAALSTTKPKTQFVDSGTLLRMEVGPRDVAVRTDVRKQGKFFYTDVKTGKDVDLSEIEAPPGYKVHGVSQALLNYPRKNMYVLRLTKDEKKNALGFDVPITTLTTKRKKKVRQKFYDPNGVQLLPTQLSTAEKLRRMLNSAAFDRASYAADGGDNWIDPRRASFFENPTNVDTVLWRKGEEASVDAFNTVKWQFVAWYYKKHGGHFS